MLYKEIIAVCTETHVEHTNAFCGHKLEFFNIKFSGTQNNH
jgi:hypothetical protein